jgi:hypothetical protein
MGEGWGVRRVTEAGFQFDAPFSWVQITSDNHSGGPAFNKQAYSCHLIYSVIVQPPLD